VTVNPARWRVRTTRTVFTLLLSAAAQAQAAAPAVRGQLIERVACPSDPTQTYTLYLPSTYTKDRAWPLLFVFDPRGRGTHAAGIFRDAAERFGWIVASSDNTMSDGAWEPNGRALAAMWPDVRRAYAVDERRLYAAGFSGGATVAWVLARSSEGALAGIIAAGAPEPRDASADPGTLAWFGSAGRHDFNFLDARALDARMAKAGIPHRLEFFDGGHQWMTPELALRAVGWMEARAMKDGRRPADPSLAAAIVADELAYARALESAGHLTDARRLYGLISSDYSGWEGAASADARARELDANPDLQKARRAEGRADARERDQAAAAMRTLGRLAGDDVPMSAELVNALDIRRLRDAASGSTYDAGSASRVLETVYVQVSFYLPQDFEQRREFTRAAAALEIATAIFPERPFAWVGLARARAQAGKATGALAALARAVEEGFRNARMVETDPRFAAIRETAEYARIREKMGAR
jgi:dienelactone hydrolase